MRWLMIGITLLFAPLAGAQVSLPQLPLDTDIVLSEPDVVAEVVHLADDAGHAAESWISYLEEHQGCDPSDLGVVQTDGVDQHSEPKACDAPDGLAEIDFDRRVPVGVGASESARGTLVFATQGMDDTDVLALPTEASDGNWRFEFDLSLGLDQAPDLSFGVMDFDIVTLAGASLLDPDSTAYDPPGAPATGLPEPAFGNEYVTREANDDYTIDPTTYQVVGPPDHTDPPTSLFVRLEDGQWRELEQDGGPSVSKKYVGAVAPGGCAIELIVMEVPIGYDKQNSPHVGRGPAKGTCALGAPGPIKDPTSASFTLPPWLAGETLALVLFVAEHTPGALTGSADDLGASLLGLPGGLFEPQPASCDQDVCTGLVGGDQKRLPTEYVTELLKNPPATF